LSQWTTSGLDNALFFKNCVLSFQTDSDYIKQLIQTRVLHLLWQNLKQWHLPETAPSDQMYLESHIEQSSNEKPEHFLIRASMSGLAASLSGSHVVCIHHSDSKDTPEFYRRITRNIHHLLHLESMMYKNTDPLSGAYVIDHYTRRWTQGIWDRLKLEK
jgi:methylmalonyl-CoA mutase N-terminal domain/subunit